MPPKNELEIFLPNLKNFCRFPICLTFCRLPSPLVLLVFHEAYLNPSPAVLHKAHVNDLAGHLSHIKQVKDRDLRVKTSLVHILFAHWLSKTISIDVAKFYLAFLPKISRSFWAICRSGKYAGGVFPLSEVEVSVSMCGSSAHYLDVCWIMWLNILLIQILIWFINESWASDKIHKSTLILKWNTTVALFFSPYPNIPVFDHLWKSSLWDEYIKFVEHIGFSDERSF